MTFSARRNPCCSPGNTTSACGNPLRCSASAKTLGLLPRDDGVVGALQQQDGAGEAVDVVQRRALRVHVGGLRQRPDEGVQVAGLEVVGVLGQRPQVGDAVVRRPRGERVGPVRAARTVKPPALPPRIPTFPGAARPR